MIIINIDLPELESISSIGYSLWSPRIVFMNSIFVTIVKYIIDIPNCQKVFLPHAFEFVKEKSLSSIFSWDHHD